MPKTHAINKSEVNKFDFLKAQTLYTKRDMRMKRQLSEWKNIFSYRVQHSFVLETWVGDEGVKKGQTQGNAEKSWDLVLHAHSDGVVPTAVPGSSAGFLELVHGEWISCLARKKLQLSVFAHTADSCTGTRGKLCQFPWVWDIGFCKKSTFTRDFIYSLHFHSMLPLLLRANNCVW